MQGDGYTEPRRERGRQREKREVRYIIIERAIEESMQRNSKPLVTVKVCLQMGITCSGL